MITQAPNTKTTPEPSLQHARVEQSNYHKFIADFVDLIRQAQVGQGVQVVQAVPGPFAQLSQLVLEFVDLADGPALAVDVCQEGVARLVAGKIVHKDTAAGKPAT